MTTDRNRSPFGQTMSRRRLLSVGFTAGAALTAEALLVSCGGSSPLSGDVEETETPETSGSGAQEEPTATDESAEESTPAEGQATEADQSAEGGDGAPSGQIIIGQSQEPTVFNPLMAHIEVDDAVYYNLFDTLWGVDPDGEYFPLLAAEVPTIENGGISEDGLTWTITLRDDVTWHDGEPFTAEDVKFTWELIMRDDFNAGSRQGHELITEFEVLSPTEVRWTMERAYAPYLSILAETWIVPKHILEDAPDPNTADFNNAPVGTGAFMWEERVSGDHLTLTANPDYFGDGPNVETLVFKYIPDLTVFYTQFQTGEIDFTGIQGIAEDNYEEAQTLEGRVVHVGRSPGIEGIWFNYGNEQFQDPSVREALYLAMDKSTIIDDIYYGLPDQAESFLPQQSWAYNPDLPGHEYNPERAIEILENAGWVDEDGDGVREKDGVRLSFSNSTTAGNQVREQAQAYLQQNWQEIGVEMTIDNRPPAVVWGDYFFQSQYETVMVGWKYGVGADPDATKFFHSDSIPAQGGTGNNSMQYESSEADELLEEASSTLDRAEREELYHELQSIVREDLVFLPIFQYASLMGWKEGLVGVAPNPNTRTDCWNAKTWYWES